ncbi:MAG: alkaline phosphatase family protein [Rhodanobacter sp.]
MTEADPIQHVIVLMLENCSFDRMLGACQTFKSGIDGVSPDGQPRINSFDGQQYRQQPGASRVVVNDPHHDTPHVLQQLKADANGNPNSGFVQDYASGLQSLTSGDCSEVMKYFATDALPAFHTLARNFLVCDHWFSSVPGPTWANRLFAMSGTSLGRVSMPAGVMDMNLHWYDQATLFDRLDEQSVDWRVYFGDTPLSLLLVHQREPESLIRHKPMTEFFRDVASDPEESGFPPYVLIEPAYLDPGANDGHPPHDALASEALIASVYNAIRANETLWQSSLLVVLCDEHGGFYDHVSPPPTVPPDHHQDEYTFDQLGPRVPAILVSPWVANAVCPTTLDHTSLLKYLTDKWSLGPLGARTGAANTFQDCILAELRTDTPQKIPALPASGLLPVPVQPARSLNSHENAIVALSQGLESLAGEDAATVAARSRQMLSGPQSQIDAAVDRVGALLTWGSSEVQKTLG